MKKKKIFKSQLLILKKKAFKQFYTRVRENQSSYKNIALFASIISFSRAAQLNSSDDKIVPMQGIVDMYVVSSKILNKHKRFYNVELKFI